AGRALREQATASPSPPAAAGRGGGEPTGRPAPGGWSRSVPPTPALPRKGGGGQAQPSATVTLSALPAAEAATNGLGTSAPVPPVDAASMDPQQRLFLEAAWCALEDAGYGGRASEPRRFGVFVGTGAGDYLRLLQAAGQGDTAQAFLGSSSSLLPSRIAYVLD